jgi:hypothetical protein
MSIRISKTAATLCAVMAIGPLSGCAHDGGGVPPAAIQALRAEFLAG